MDLVNLGKGVRGLKTPVVTLDRDYRIWDRKSGSAYLENISIRSQVFKKDVVGFMSYINVLGKGEKDDINLEILHYTFKVIREMLDDIKGARKGFRSESIKTERTYYLEFGREKLKKSVEMISGYLKTIDSEGI